MVLEHSRHVRRDEHATRPSGDVRVGAFVRVLLVFFVPEQPSRSRRRLSLVGSFFGSFLV